MEIWERERAFTNNKDVLLTSLLPLPIARSRVGARTSLGKRGPYENARTCDMQHVKAMPIKCMRFPLPCRIVKRNPGSKREKSHGIGAALYTKQCAIRCITGKESTHTLNLQRRTFVRVMEPNPYLHCSLRLIDWLPKACNEWLCLSNSKGQDK